MPGQSSAEAEEVEVVGGDIGRRLSLSWSIGTGLCRSTCQIPYHHSRTIGTGVAGDNPFRMGCTWHNTKQQLETVRKAYSTVETAYRKFERT